MKIFYGYKTKEGKVKVVDIDSNKQIEEVKNINLKQKMEKIKTIKTKLDDEFELN